MTPEEIAKKLDDLYNSSVLGYAKYLAGIKSMGYRVFYDKKGHHRVVIDGTSTLAFLKSTFGMED